MIEILMAALIVFAVALLMLWALLVRAAIQFCSRFVRGMMAAHQAGEWSFPWESSPSTSISASTPSASWSSCLEFDPFSPTRGR
jgi:hypothetical protein